MHCIVPIQYFVLVMFFFKLSNFTKIVIKKHHILKVLDVITLEELYAMYEQNVHFLHLNEVAALVREIIRHLHYKRIAP